jgi:TonB family protein
LRQTFINNVNYRQNRSVSMLKVVWTLIGLLIFGFTGARIWRGPNDAQIVCTITASALNQPGRPKSLPGAVASAAQVTTPSESDDPSPRPPMWLKLPTPSSAKVREPSATTQPELVDTAVAFDAPRIPELSKQPAPAPPMPPINAAHRPEQSASEKFTPNDTATEVVAAPISVGTVAPNVPRPREQTLFGESACEQPKNCPYRRTRDDWYCSSANSNLRFGTLPAPKYTTEAQKLHIQGEIRVVAIFAGDGEIRIERLLNSLGYGLDESAIAAVRQIGFRPAVREGCSVDSEQTIRVTFGSI